MALVIAVAMVLAMGVVAFAEQTEHGTDNANNKGSITITNATVGKKYGIYKLFDATVALNEDGTAKTGADGKPIISYTVPAGKTLAEDNAWFAVDSNGNVTAKTGADITTDAFKTWAESFGTVVKENVVATDTTLTFDQLEFGYYYIKSEVGAVLTVDSTTPDVTVIDKNQTPEFDKNIKDDEELVKWNEAGLAIDVPFDITVKAKNYDGDYKVYEYTIKDTLDPGFTFKNDLKVKVGDVDKTADSLTTIKYYTDSSKTTETTYDKATYFEIVVKWTQDGDKEKDHLYPANETINVTYTAFLDPAKADKVKVGKTANENTADVTYKKFKGDDDVEGDLPDKKTKTFETKLTITKTDGSNALAGAEFTLETTDGTKVSYTSGEVYVPATDGTYYLLNDGTYTDTAPTTATASQYASETQKYKKESVASTGNGQTVSTMKAFVGSDGKLTFSGLGIGTYTLKETVVPKGYNKADDIVFTISADVDDTDPNNVIVKFASDNDDVVLDATNNVFNTTVVNNKGTELPSTGGIGTTIFYVIGAILVLGAGILLVTRRRMNAN